MKLGLLGFPVDHSLSPAIYKKLLGDKLTSYKLFSYEKPELIPSLSFFADQLDGLNITSPYKKHFIPDIEIHSKLVKSLGIVNTLAFSGKTVLGTNTDLLAVVEILMRYQKNHTKLQILLLGDGAMAEVTKLVASDLNIPIRQFSRKTLSDLSHLDLRSYSLDQTQTLVINACSRDFVFQGKAKGDEIFWDYNYSFIPHQSTLPSLFKSYQDGQEMLELQAKEALKFWNQVNSKLK